MAVDWMRISRVGLGGILRSYEENAVHLQGARTGSKARTQIKVLQYEGMPSTQSNLPDLSLVPTVGI